MSHSSTGKTGVSLWVLAGMILLAVILGILNNLRVYDEQRVPWFGSGVSAESAESAETETDGTEAGR